MAAGPIGAVAEQGAPKAAMRVRLRFLLGAHFAPPLRPSCSRAASIRAREVEAIRCPRRQRSTVRGSDWDSTAILRTRWAGVGIGIERLGVCVMRSSGAHKTMPMVRSVKVLYGRDADSQGPPRRAARLSRSQSSVDQINGQESRFSANELRRAPCPMSDAPTTEWTQFCDGAEEIGGSSEPPAREARDRRC